MEKYFKKDRITVDLGGGNGFHTYSAQRKGYNMVLIEPSQAGCKNAELRGVKNILCGTFSSSSIKNGSVNQILLLDVLEHIEDDNLFLRTIYDKLDGG